jgi:predicted metal-dependent enzyme (double-stranded beta helix superfamily)
MFVYATVENEAMDRDELVAQCIEANADAEPRHAIRAVLEKAISDRELTDALGDADAGLGLLHNTDTLTVINVLWPPRLSLFPHNHRMWAMIGIYGGREDNRFYRRDGNTLVESGGKSLDAGDVLLLGDDVIHSVDNPGRSYTGAIHIYGGDFVHQPRSQWNAETLIEEPFDMAAVQEQFAAAERAFRE